jgi:outer membrane scaffolding protein for murein synthesis (MipA/OmpV family)
LPELIHLIDMKKLLALALSSLSGIAVAQTPAVNLMPDGSRDMYIGLGAIAQPRYEGSDEHRTRVLPLLQVEFSNGIFLSGLSAGWHLSQRPSLEFGPLLSVHPGRDKSGLGGGLGGVTTALTGADREIKNNSLLQHLDDINPRLTGGVFLNYYLTPQLRLNNSLLYGAGGNGLVWETSVQKLAAEMDARHRVSLQAGLTVVNRHYNATFFAVPEAVERLAQLPHRYAPDGGVKDVFVGARWTWALSPSWIVTTSARASRLTGDARKSPLVERSNQFSISTGLAHRF